MLAIGDPAVADLLWALRTAAGVGDIVTLTLVAVLAFAVVWSVAFTLWGVLSLGKRLTGRRPAQKSATGSRPRRPLRRLSGCVIHSRRARLAIAVGAVFFAGVVAGQVARGPADGRQFALIREAWISTSTTCNPPISTPRPWRTRPSRE